MHKYYNCNLGRELEWKRYTNGQQVYEKMFDIIQHQENEKKKVQWNVILHMSEWLSSKKQQIISSGKDVEKRESLYTVGGDVHWDSHWKK